MPDDKKTEPAPEADEAMDRRAYLRTVRNEMLKNLGLPENTKPEQVGLLLEIKARMDKLKEK
jgi:hypothetical protein